MTQSILFYTPFLKMGGIEKASIDYIHLLKDLSCNVLLLVDYDMGADNVLASQVPDGVDVVFVKGNRLARFLYSLRTLAKRLPVLTPVLFCFVVVTDFFLFMVKVRPLLKKCNVDTTISFYQFLPTYIARHLPGRHYLWLHGSVEHFFTGWRQVFRGYYLRKLQAYDGIVTVAREMQTQLQDIFPQLTTARVRCIYNPFDFQKILVMARSIDSLTIAEQSILGKPYILHVSRVDESQKDIATLLRAFARLTAIYSEPVSLIIVGVGPDIAKMIRLAKSLDIFGRVQFVGNQVNPYVWMRHAKMLVLSSKFEGFGLVLVEAMSVGTFVLASACKTGPREILGDGRYGDLFEVGNDFELANRIYRVLTDSAYRKAKIARAAQGICRFDKASTKSQLSVLLNLTACGHEPGQQVSSAA